MRIAYIGCICEIRGLALDEFDLNTVHKLSSKEKKSRRSQDSNLGLLGGKQECSLPGIKLMTLELFSLLQYHHADVKVDDEPDLSGGRR